MKAFMMLLAMVGLLGLPLASSAGEVVWIGEEPVRQVTWVCGKTLQGEWHLTRDDVTYGIFENYVRSDGYVEMLRKSSTKCEIIRVYQDRMITQYDHGEWRLLATGKWQK